MELIVGNSRVVPTAIRRIPGGIEAQLAGEALLRFLDVTCNADQSHHVSIEVLGGEYDRREMDVTEIRMRGSVTTVTLICSSKPANLH